MFGTFTVLCDEVVLTNRPFPLQTFGHDHKRKQQVDLTTWMVAAFSSVFQLQVLFLLALCHVSLKWSRVLLNVISDTVLLLL